MLLVSDSKHFLLERRASFGLWGGLLSLPEKTQNQAKAFARQHGCQLLKIETLPAIKHSFTHFRLHIDPVLCLIKHRAPYVAQSGWEWVDYVNIEKVAVPAPIRRLLRMAVLKDHQGNA